MSGAMALLLDSERPRWVEEVLIKLFDCGWNWRRSEVIAGFQ